MNVWLAEIWRAWRASLRKPGFLLLATGVLALGIGASAGAFTLVDDVLLKPLPFAQPQQLIALMPSRRPDSFSYISPRQYEHMLPLQGVASSGLILNSTQLAVVGGARKLVLAHQTWISAGLLHTLGMHMVVGHDFGARDYTAHGPPAVLLSHQFWLRHFGGSAGVVGKTITVAGSAHTVVGVLPAGFRKLSKADVVRPMATDTLYKKLNGSYIALARLDGSHTASEVAAQATARIRTANPAKLPAALAQMMAVTRAARKARFGQASHLSIVAESVRPLLTGNKSLVVEALQACGLLVLLVALVNLVNLMVLRAASSTHSVAVRSALGATGPRLALPVLAEGLLVGLLGGVVGAALGWVGLQVLRHFAASAWLGGATLPASGWVWLLAIGVGIAVSVLASWLGQRRARRQGTTEELRENAPSGLGPRAGRLAGSLVVLQVVLATVLLMGTAMLGRSVVQMSGRPTGFDAAHVLVFKTKLPAALYAKKGSIKALAKRLRARLHRISGVEDATIATHLPIGLAHNYREFFQAKGNHISAENRGIDGKYFRTFGIPMIAGHGFTRADLINPTLVAVVNQHLARHEFHGNAVGKLLGSGPGAMRIIGVVANTAGAGKHPQNQMYMPRPQFYKPAFWSVAVRVHGAPGAYFEPVRAAMAEVAPHLPIADMRSMVQAVRETTGESRSNLLLVGLLAGLALLLAAAGQYAVMMSSVAAREREFGIRMALGGSPGRLTRWIMGHGMRRIVLGLVVGVALGVGISLLLRRLILSLGRTPIDLWAIGATCVVLVLAGLLACLLPALRAGRVQPMRALRGE